ncbi:YfhO family protein [Psychroflexus sp. YR1-1]|uniref:YfhO family protein n=1 Tax=Psychroflexus aurantiacus TaxID=2709310 RepID=A0A6B3R0H6_9FLAO|nr:YfhO family protein [Psychroflexus aurantiacus]NEV94056.1 YfhO family protein [Psychroflexus aurantiacus]
MKSILKNSWKHLAVLVLFVIASLAFFYPVLKGKTIFQSDIVQYTGMAKAQNDFRATEGEEPYWTNSAFGGMPTYQLGANYPYNFIKEIDRTLRFLPRPADYLFLYFVGMYILFLCMKVNYKLAFLGALAFGFSTYLIIILGVGHNAKAHAIAYFPLVVGGMLLVYRQKLFWGNVLFCVGLAFELMSNHFQMTYYLMLLCLVIVVVNAVYAFKSKTFTPYLKASLSFIPAIILAVLLNITNLLATQEYAEFSTRGDTGLSIDPDGTKQVNTGLDYEYITEYSYGIFETFNLFIPRFMGGSNSESLGKDSEVYKEIIQMGASPLQALEFSKNLPTYWGKQPIVAAPAYIGACVIFLFVLALFLTKGKTKWWLVAGSVMALLLSWGDNFSLLTNFFIDYVPFYDKFRAITSIQVIIEFCLPVLAILGISKLITPEISNQAKWKALKTSTLILGGLSLFFLLLKSALFDFSGSNDAVFLENYGAKFVRALKEDRKSMFTADTIRSLIFVLLIAGSIYLYLKDKVKKPVFLGLIGILILIDLIGVDTRYVNEDDFVAASVMERPFQATPADLEIQNDQSHFRVYDLTSSPLNSARASYFHNSIGGYHAAKPGRIQELFDFYIYEGKQSILNMLNVKYFIFDEQGEAVVQENPGHLGNAWFVNELITVEDANAAILALDSINPGKTAIVEENQFPLSDKNYNVDPSDVIELTAYKENELVYKYEATGERLALFSELYYPKGWKVTLDGKEVNHFRANYVLRAMHLPAGSHQITFSFEPDVVSFGGKISLASFILLALIILGGLGYSLKRKQI